MSVVEELRNKASRDNRELLDRAAAEVERLEVDYVAMVADIKSAGYRDVCEICKHHNENEDCECDCEKCKKPCTCQKCYDCSLWEWRGRKEGEIKR